METVKISPKFQVVIPARIRASLDLKPGQKMHVLSYQNRVEFIPVMEIRKSRGMFKGINTDFEREKIVYECGRQPGVAGMVCR
jgi:AbrB family looped-hinge helix DNA binding protein